MRAIVTARTQHELRTMKIAEDLLTDPRRVDPDYLTGIHEMGHVLDLMGGSDNTGRNTRTRERLRNELIKHYIQKFPDRAKDVTYQEGPGYEVQQGVGTGMPEFRQWLRNQLPGGAFQGNPSVGDFAGMNYAEGPAHAFTEVELNPQANEVSRLIHKVMTEESRPETSQVLKERMDNPYYRQHWEREYGDYPGYDPTPPPAAPSPEPKINHDTFEDILPYGIEKAVGDVRKKYPQVNLRGVDVDEQNSGGTAFVIPEVSYGLTRGKQNKPQMSVERKWVDADPSEWDKWMDKDADEGFFPRWQSTTAGEPWPEDAIEDAMTENDINPAYKPPRAAALNPANRVDPAELSWRDLLWMNNVMRDTTTGEQNAYADALDAELARRSDQHLDRAARVAMPLPSEAHDPPYWSSMESGLPRAKTPENPSWYHVSPAELAPGARLTPRGGASPWPTGFYDDKGLQGRQDWVWSTDDLESARGLGQDFAALRGRSHLYRITPDDGPFAWNQTGNHGWVSNGATVNELVESFDRPPPAGKTKKKHKKGGLFADPDGTGVWTIDAVNQSVRFVPAPFRVSD